MSVTSLTPRIKYKTGTTGPLAEVRQFPVQVYTEVVEYGVLVSAMKSRTTLPDLITFVKSVYAGRRQSYYSNYDARLAFHTKIGNVTIAAPKAVIWILSESLAKEEPPVYTGGSRNRFGHEGED